MLKYGGGSSHARSQPLDDVCRDLHCQRDRYTWTSHPALEGTACGTSMVTSLIEMLKMDFFSNWKIKTVVPEWSMRF